MKWQYVDRVYSEVTSSLANGNVFFITLQTRFQKAFTIGKGENECQPKLEVKDALCPEKGQPTDEDKEFSLPEGQEALKKKKRGIS